MSDFWQTWMKLWCLSGALFGVILLGADFETTIALPKFYFTLLEGPGEPTLDANARISLVILGAVMIGWTLTLWTTIHAANQLGHKAARPIWFMLTGAMTSWFLIDSSLSVHSGYWRNTLPNIAFMATFLLPVLRSGVLKK